MLPGIFPVWIASSTNISGNGRFAGKMLRARYDKIMVYDGMRRKRAVVSGDYAAIVRAFPLTLFTSERPN